MSECLRIFTGYFLFLNKTGNRMKRITEDLQHIQKMICKLERVNNYTKDMDYEDFVTEKSRREAILKQLHMVSEEALMISPKAQDKIPMRELGVLKGFRNALYLYQIESDSHMMWKRIQRVLPKIESRLKEMLGLLQTEQEGRRAA
jgi:uncharacterized protein with HEPN domain